MNTVTANALKTKGMSTVEAQLEENEEVVMDIEECSQLREYELEVALKACRPYL